MLKVKELPDFGVTRWRSGSVTNVAEIEKLMAETLARYGHIDVLFVNQGMSESINFLDITENDLQSCDGYQLQGCFLYGAESCATSHQGPSLILCISDSVHMALAQRMHYTASKQALDSFRRTMAASLVGLGIRVNALCPGRMMTEMVHDADRPWRCTCL